MGHYRQGDVLIIQRTGELPAGAAKKLAEPILADGEVTGHAHRLTEGEVFADGADTADAVSRWLIAGKHAAVVHEEHAAIVLSPGLHEVRRQVEYNPADRPESAWASNSFRRVAD